MKPLDTNLWNTDNFEVDSFNIETELTEDVLTKNGFGWTNDPEMKYRLIIYFKNKTLRTDILWDSLELHTFKDLIDLNKYLKQ